MIWSLRFHCREGGFYRHYEYADTESYRWPGFTDGDVYNESVVLSYLRERAYAVDGQLPPRIPAPRACPSPDRRSFADLLAGFCRSAGYLVPGEGRMDLAGNSGYCGRRKQGAIPALFQR